MTSIDDDTTATWAQITLFQVFKDYAAPGMAEDIGVFSNGRQQCRIQVAFEARDAGGNPVTLTQDDIRNHVRLIDYQTGQPIGGSWEASFAASDYEWDESIITGLQAPQGRRAEAADASPGTRGAMPLPASAQTVTFYVSAKAAGRLSIGAQIGFPNGAPPARTNHLAVELNKPEGDGAGQFNSFVNATATAFPSLSEQNYGDRTTTGLRMDEVGNKDHFFRAYQAYVNVNFNGRRLALKSVSGASQEQQGFSIYKYGLIVDQWKWAVSYYAQPGADSPENFPLPPLSRIDIAMRRAGHEAEATRDAVTRIADTAIDGITRIALAAIGVPGHDKGARVEGGVPQAEPRQSYDFKDMFDQCVGRIESPSDDTVVVGVLTGAFAGRFKAANGADTPEIASARLYLMDVYGNEHALAIGFDKLPQLTLRKA